MTDVQKAQLAVALRDAVTLALKEVGIAGLKATSLFLSNERSVAKKAA